MKQNNIDQENNKKIHVTDDGSVTVYNFKSFLDNIYKTEPEKNGDESLEILEKRIPNLVLDFKDVEYISSSGLRPILSIKQNNPDLRIINASEAVYNTLEMTGFTNMIRIYRAPIRIEPIDPGTEPIGRGSNGAIYSIGEDEIVKMFTDKSTNAQIEREWLNARAAFSAGVPTAICYAIVTDGTNRGIMYEKMKTRVFAEVLKSDMENFDDHAEKLAEFFYSIHDINCTGYDLISIKDMYLEYLDQVDYLDPELIVELKRFLQCIPDSDTFVHGDFHSQNVFYGQDGMLLIDMGGCGYGHPIFDFAFTFIATVWISRRFPQFCERITGFDLQTVIALWDKIVAVCFPGADKEEVEWINRLVDRFAGFCAIFFPILHPDEEREAMIRMANLGMDIIGGHMDEMLDDLHRLDEKYISVHRGN